MFDQAAGKKIKFRLSVLIDQEPVSNSIEKTQRSFAHHIQHLLLILDVSPTGRALLNTAVQHHVSIGIDPLLESSSSFFYPRQNHFDLGYQSGALQNTDMGDGRYLASFVSGLRRAWHHLQGHSADVSLKPADFLSQFRYTEADVDSVTLLIGWELRAAGYSSLWRYLLSGTSADMAEIFERTVMADAPTQFDGRALKRAFNQWFAERDRANACDRRGLEILDMVLMQVAYSGQPIEQTYRLGTRQIRRDQVQYIGMLPNGTNYLAGCSFTSGWYDGLDDELNRHHLKNIEWDIRQLSDNKEYIRKFS